MTEAKPQNYWISPTALRITLNALSDADYIQASAASGAMIMCYMKGIDGLEYDHGHNYKRWPLRIAPTYFTTASKKYVYVRIPRPTADPADVETDIAQVVFPSEHLDIYGYNESEELIGDERYYYIWLQGIISASEPSDAGLRRHWEQEVDTGTLDSDEAYDSGGDGTWWVWNKVTDMVTFTKTIAYAMFEYLQAAQAEVRNLTVTNLLEAFKGYIDDLRSHNFSPGLLDGSGWRITTDNGEGGSEMEVDFLKVRKKATFMELEVRKETFVGGNQNYSPAGSIIYKVDYLDENDNPQGYTVMKVPFLLKRFDFLGRIFNYAARKRIQRQLTKEEWARVHHFRCYLLADDGTTATRNWWQVGDQPRCQSFNKAVSAADKREHTYNAHGQAMEDPATPMPEYNYTPDPIETAYYWRLCSNTGAEKLDDGHVYDFIDMPYEGWSGYSEADRRSFRDGGSGIPVAGDHIVCFGNRYNEERMNMISIQTTGKENNPPAIKGYRGIHTFKMEQANKVFEISPDQILFRSNRFKFLYDDGNVLPPAVERGEWQRGQRYRYYDRVSWAGSIWLCMVLDDFVWEDASGNQYADGDVTEKVVGEGEFTYFIDGVEAGTDHYYKTGSAGGVPVYYIRMYTYLEPKDDNDLWLREVSKGTEITKTTIRYAASLDGVNHPEGGDDDDDDEGFDPSGVEVPSTIKSQATELLQSFTVALGMTPATGGLTHEYLSKMLYEADSQWKDGKSAYGLPLICKKELFPSLRDYYGTQADANAFRGLAGWLFATVLTEIRPDRRDALLEAGYKLGPDKSTFIYKYKFEHDQNINRLIASVIWAAMRGVLKPDMGALRTELGGSKLSINLADAQKGYASYASTYYPRLMNFMPSAPGPYLAAYEDRSVPGIPYDDYDLADHNLEKDLDIYNEAVANYNLVPGSAHYQDTVQAIADKDINVAHQIGPDRNEQGYKFHAVFGTESIGRMITAFDSDGKLTDVAKLLDYVTEAGIASRQALKQGAWDGRRRPGQSETQGRSKDGAEGVLLNYTIDNIDGHPVTEYSSEGEYNEAERGQVYANSYPSGHSSGIWAAALFLVELLPWKADKIMKAANEVAKNRQVTRYHWNSDTIVGRLSGAAVAPVMRASKDWDTLYGAAYEELNGNNPWKKTIEATGIKMGWYLWTRTTIYYDDPNNPDREPTVEYSVSRWGIDGDGISEMDSYYLATSNADLVITAATDKFPMPGDSSWAAADPQKKWFNTFGEAAQANGGVGQMQGWNVWEKSVVIYDAYDKQTGDPVTKPDLVNYKCSRIGQDGQIGQEEYYMLAESDNFNTVFGSAAPDYDHIGIRWYKQSDPAAENWRLSPATPNINTQMWKSVMPAYQEGSAKKYLWNFEQRVDGMGTEYATKPVCIGNHARGIKGVLELYALSASGTPRSGGHIPADIYAANGNSETDYSHSDPTKPKTWTDEIYDRAPTEALPYQWNWTRTLYETPRDAADTARDPNTGLPFEDHYHVSSVKGTAGEDGSGVEYIYKLTTTDTPPANPSNPADRTVDDYVPSGWSDNPHGVSYRYPYEWQCERKSKSQPSTGGFSSGHVWGDFTAPKLWSKWGLNGKDGDGTEYVFIRTKTGTAPVIIAQTDSYTDTEGRTYKDAEFLPKVTGNANIENNGGRYQCTDDPKGVDSTWQFEWVAKRHMGSADGETGVRIWQKYSALAMSLWANFSEDGADGKDGKDGKDGAAGHVGRWYYYAGVWSPTETYRFEATRAPYVKRGNNFYMLDFAADPSAQQSSATSTSYDDDPLDYNSGDPWSPMTATFKYIITEALFTKGAYLGSFIFNEDWMISQHGLLYGSGSPHVIDDTHSYGGYTKDNAYTVFSPNYPNGKDPSKSYNFCPNFAVDGKTGKSYLNDLYAKGTINATGGSITGDMVVGTTDNKVLIYPDETVGSPVAFRRSGIKGVNGSDILLNLGFSENKVPFLTMNNPTYSGKPSVVMQANRLEFSVSNGRYFHVGFTSDGKVHVQAGVESWPTRDDVSIGEMYLGDDEILRVRRT